MIEAGQVYEVTSWADNQKGLWDIMKELELVDIIGQFPLPTEVVLTSMNPIIPLTGRIYEVKGVSISDKVVVELWQNWGEDGHTDMRLRGFMVVSTKDIIVNNDKSFMKTSAWLQDLIDEKYMEWYKAKIWNGKEGK